MGCELMTVEGDPELLMTRSADAATVVVAVAELSPGDPSLLADVIVAVLLSTLPDATLASTATVSVNTSLPTLKLGLLQVMVPLLPTAGVVHDQPATLGNETKFVPAGSVSLHDADGAGLGPLLVAVIV